MARKHFTPERGTIYDNHGGGTFVCVGVPYRCHIGIAARMQNIKSGWTFTARGIHKYEDGTIDWDYSVDGQFKEVTI